MDMEVFTEDHIVAQDLTDMDIIQDNHTDQWEDYMAQQVVVFMADHTEECMEAHTEDLMEVTDKTYCDN